MEWIRIEERKPTKKECNLGILVYDLKEGVHEAEINSDGEFEYPYYGQEIGGGFKNVIAWRTMPLKP